MDRSVAQGGPPDPDASPWPDPRTARWISILVGLLLALAAMAIYLATRTDRYYDHFVWQAAAFLEGHAAIRYPVEASGALPGNAYFQDVLPVATHRRRAARAPAVPAAAGGRPAAVRGGVGSRHGRPDDLHDPGRRRRRDLLVGARVACAVRPAVRLGATVFFAFGTVFWYTAQVATTWYQAHIVAVGLSLLAVGIALRGDPAPADADEPAAHGMPATARPVPASGRPSASIAASSPPGCCSGSPARRA